MAEQHARAAAEEALKVRDRFLSVASHELKTPVATLQLAAESLLRAHQLGRLDEARLETGIARILRSAARLGDLVSELLDVSLLSSERHLASEPTDVVAIVSEVAARFADVEDNTQRIRVDAPASAVVTGDASRLDQVFTNLIDNALKYSPAGEPIDISVAHDADGVTVSVADRGIGLGEDTEARLFEAFSRGENATHVPGLGLGLFITHQIVKRHGGHIDAQRGPDGFGSLFRVWLPKDAS
jgi:signal transduction histidine kinase